MLPLSPCVCVCLCVSDASPGSRPTLQIHHPRVTGPHQGGVPVSSGTVPQVGNTNTHIHSQFNPCRYRWVHWPALPFVICPPTLNLTQTTIIVMNKTPSSGLILTHKPGLGSCTYASDPDISVSAYAAVGPSLGDVRVRGCLVGSGLHKSLLIFTCVCSWREVCLSMCTVFFFVLCVLLQNSCWGGLAATGERREFQIAKLSQSSYSQQQVVLLI